jgi:hypothetical protein
VIVPFAFYYVLKLESQGYRDHKGEKVLVKNKSDALRA